MKNKPKVLKRNGSIEPFIKEKLITSLTKTGYDLEKARKSADRIEEKYKDREVVKFTDLKREMIRELNSEKAIEEVDEPSAPMEFIEETEKRLEGKLSFDSKEILLLNFKNPDSFNEFSTKMNDRSNVRIADVEVLDEDIVAEIVVTPKGQKIIV